MRVSLPNCSLRKHTLERGNDFQKLRLYRFYLALASYGVCWFVVVCFSLWGVFRLSFPQTLFFVFCSIMGNLVFYLIFRTGLNRRFKDPSLTTPQIVEGTVFIMGVIYFTNAYRGTLLLLYFIAFIFGVFRYNRRQFIVMALFGTCSYGLVIALLAWRHPEVVVLKVDILQGIVLAVTLLWFSVVGGYLSDLRKRLTRSYAALSHAYQKMEEIATHDELTGLLNRRRIMEYVVHEKDRSDRFGTPFSIALVDVDFFKRINDTFGHAVGDEVLSTFGVLVGHCIRKVDKVGRYGGEEFLILLVGATLDNAVCCLERCRRSIATARFPSLPEGYGVTISCGVVEYRQGETVDTLLRRADEALYRAKHAGRNTVWASA